MVSEAKLAANRQNAQKSTGPRTPAGKDKSKYNAVTHGATARSALLPGEDVDAFEALQQMMISRFNPVNDTELTVVERIAIDVWTSDRAAQAASRRLAERLRHEPLEQSEKEADEAIKLGALLLWQPSFPLPLTKRFQVGELTEPPCSDNAIHPQHPARLCLRLEQTVAGCDWLLDRWGDLWERVTAQIVWQSSDAFHMVRLMGKHAVNMADDLDVAGVFLASLTLLAAPKGGPERESFDWKHAMIKMLMTYDAEQDHGDWDSVTKHCGPFARRLAELPLGALAPKDDEHARQWLISRIKQELERIREIRAMLVEIADADLAEAPARLAFETGAEGDRHRRYVLSNERLLNRRFSMFLSTRKMSCSSDVNGSLSVDAFDDAELANRTPGTPINSPDQAWGVDATDPGYMATSDGPPKFDTPSWTEGPGCEIALDARADWYETAVIQETAAATAAEADVRGHETDGQLCHVTQAQCRAPETDGPTDDVSHAREATCDCATILRNEPNSSRMKDLSAGDTQTQASPKFGDLADRAVSRSGDLATAQETATALPDRPPVACDHARWTQTVP
jgi:hypothetical protein